MRLKLTLAFCSFAALPLLAGVSFKPGPVVPAEGNAPLIADFNHDGLDDVVSSAIDGTHRLLNSGGVLVPAGDLPIPGNSNLVAAADVDGDGNLDILANTYIGSPCTGPAVNQTLYLGKGNLSFEPAYTVPAPWRAQLLADMYGDGKADIVVTRRNCDDSYSHCSWTVAFVSALPDGTFERKGETTFPASGSVMAIAAGDLNNDGHADLVVRLEDDLLILLGRGDGTFAAPVRRYFPCEWA